MGEEILRNGGAEITGENTPERLERLRIIAVVGTGSRGKSMLIKDLYMHIYNNNMAQNQNITIPTSKDIKPVLWRRDNQNAVLNYNNKRIGFSSDSDNPDHTFDTYLNALRRMGSGIIVTACHPDYSDSKYHITTEKLTHLLNDYQIFWVWAPQISNSNLQKVNANYALEHIMALIDLP